MRATVWHGGSAVTRFVRLNHSELDDVMVDFVAGMICSDESDTDQLIEMLNAYIPQFGEIET